MKTHPAVQSPPTGHGGVHLEQVVDLIARPRAGDDLMAVLRRGEIGARIFGAVALTKLMQDGMKRSDYLDPLLAHGDVAAWRVAFEDAASILGMRENKYGRRVELAPRKVQTGLIPFGEWSTSKPPREAGGRLPGRWLYDDEITMLRSGWSPPPERAQRRRDIAARELTAAYDWLLSKLVEPVWLIGRGAETRMVLPWVPYSAPEAHRYVDVAPFIELGDGTIRLLREAIPGGGCRWDELTLEPMDLDEPGAVSVVTEHGLRWSTRGAIDYYTRKYGEILAPTKRASTALDKPQPVPPARDHVYVYDEHRIERARFELAEAWRALGHPILSLPVDWLYALLRVFQGKGDGPLEQRVAEALTTWDGDRANSGLPGLVVTGGRMISPGTVAFLREGLGARGIIACVMSSEHWKEGEEHRDRFEHTALPPLLDTPETVATLLRGGLAPEVAWTDGFLDTFRLTIVSDIPAFLRALDDGLRTDESLRTDLVRRGELILGRNGRGAVFASVWRAFIDGFQDRPVPWPGAPWRAGDAARRANDDGWDTMAKP